VVAYAFIESKTVSVYKKLRESLETRGFTILAAVVDGRRGVKEVFLDIVQMCQFHQLMILRRYLTMNPRLEAGKKLREISS